MTINLPPDLQQFVAERVANGRYATEDEVVRAALELLARREQDRFEQLDAIAAKGLASLEAVRNSRRSAEDIKRMARERFLS
jgi:putative addiction module CopG family antidote